MLSKKKKKTPLRHIQFLISLIFIFIIKYYSSKFAIEFDYFKLLLLKRVFKAVSSKAWNV